MRTARLATLCVALAVAGGLLQAPALAAASDAETVTVASETTDPVDPAEPSDPADPSDPTVPGDPSVPVPSELAAVVNADGSVTVSFALEATDLELRNVQYSSDGGTRWFKADPATTSGPLVVKGLERGVEHVLLLRTVARGLVSYPSEPIAVTVPFRPVVMKVDGKVVTSGATVQAGSEVIFDDLPPGAKVTIADRSDPGMTVPVTPTKRVRIARSEPLPPARDYVISVTAASGAEVSALSLRTKDAPRFTATVWPTDNNLGSGVPLVVNFSQPVRDKAAAERALEVTATKDFGKAGWFWVGSSKAVFRPQKYWPGNTTIEVDADLSAVRGADGAWGQDQVSSRFKTGDQVILKVNLNSHRMKYIRNGKLERSFRISGGKSGWLTESGVKVLTAHIPHKRLYNPDPEDGWDVQVRWAIRVNDNGEYIHDATWNYSIGYANTSHGCTNMTYSDMAWVYNNTKFGDVAVYTGSSAKIGTDDYLAGYWNYSWSEWKQGSALSKGR